MAAPLLLGLSNEAARAASLLDLDIDALSQIEVRSATGFKMPARDAPAVVTVLTAAQIEALGALSLEEALQGIVGLHITPKNRNPNFVIRGVATFDNPEVLVTLNDVPINQVLTGALGLGVQLPLAAVERIEVVRGPGSAVFGADAFTGVINIVTRDPMREPETVAGMNLGAFGARGAWVRSSTRVADWGLMLSAQTQRSDGDRGRRVQADQQTEFDAIFGSKASLAPGSLDTQYRVSNFHAELSRPNLQVRLWHYRADRLGNAWGVGGALDPTASTDVRQSLGELRWQLPGSSAELSSSLRASWMHFWFDAQYKVFPPGTTLPVDEDGVLFGPGKSRLFTFTEGAIGNPGLVENDYRLEWESNYAGWDGHRLRLALGLSQQNFHAWESKNFSNGGPAGILRDVTNTPYVYEPDLSRRNRYLSLQDVWHVSEGIDVTLGVRADHYNDFGSSVNPRASLVWRHTPSLSSKWLYGQAFRAPSMKEQYVASNPLNLGSKSLQPERVQTLEWQGDWIVGPNFSTRLAVFHNRFSELIRLVSKVYRNVGELSGPGFELEFDWRAFEACRFALNYAYQRIADEHGQPAPLAPRQTLNLIAEQRLSPALKLNGQLRWVGERPREAGDMRSGLPAYRLLDLGLQWQPAASAWSWRLGLRNALDAKATEPTDSSALQGDNPLAGREWRLDFRMAF
ncbi:TonB-dependent receptor plug domain-containing protein [Paucibacter sp. Y2R2-4]|uniref:TonB-dependent receptor plug domain-containing protein n=1 Tax=Paucibacter sp. Y2R2-4 TaxID=2893553 RepID=UPI0021E4DFA5|nr:TonB-dependent receptor [Paucibacter sp. Y2R2-4]MCV2351900.1 TonB-dependent receptor [Paucibacter sp. Y2R2-4]